METPIEEVLFLLSDEDYITIWKRLGMYETSYPLQAILNYNPDMKTLLNAIPEKREFLLHKLSENIFLKIQQDFDNGIYIELPESEAKKELFAYAITLPSYPSEIQADILLGWIREGMPLILNQTVSIVLHWENWNLFEILNYSNKFHEVLIDLPNRGLIEIGEKVFEVGPYHKYFKDFLRLTEREF